MQNHTAFTTYGATNGNLSGKILYDAEPEGIGPILVHEDLVQNKTMTALLTGTAVNPLTVQDTLSKEVEACLVMEAYQLGDTTLELKEGWYKGVKQTEGNMPMLTLEALIQPNPTRILSLGECIVRMVSHVRCRKIRTRARPRESPDASAGGANLPPHQDSR